MSKSPSSLRDLYSQPPDIWTFPQGNQSAASSSTTGGSGPARNGQLQWGTRPKHNPLFDLAPRQAEPSSVELNVTLNGLLAHALLQYATAAVAMPWEVGKLLLQIQYIPKDDLESEASSPPEIGNDEDVQDQSESSDESYFQEPDGSPSFSESLLNSKSVGSSRHQIGSRTAKSPRSEFIIPVGPSDGVWGMIKRVGRWRSEGWSSLYKGLLTACVTDAISGAMQPLVHNSLASLFPHAHQASTLLFPVISHLVTGLLLSPLDLVRTRLIAQSATTPHRAYSGPLDALGHILREEGGFRGVYLHPHLLVPAIMDNALRPFITLSLPFLISNSFGVADSGHTVALTVVDFVAGCAGLLFTLPVETVRRRLQVQVRGTAIPFQACVRTRPKPYVGVVDTFWRICTEERSESTISPTSARAKRKSRSLLSNRDSWVKQSGIAQLYRGLNMGVGASVIVLVLSIITGGIHSSSGWAEL